MDGLAVEELLCFDGNTGWALLLVIMKMVRKGKHGHGGFLAAVSSGLTVVSDGEWAVQVEVSLWCLKERSCGRVKVELTVVRQR
jgi:hypothetical protein